MYRGTFAIIDEAAIRQNVAAIRERVTGGAKLLVAVKANGYGHGMEQAARAARAGGADYFGVATLEEALELRQTFPKVPILVLGVVSPLAAQAAAANHIDITVTEDWSKFSSLPHFSPSLRAHLKVDTGMTRLGFRDEEALVWAARWFQERSDMHLVGVFSHLACADDKQLDHARSQISTFNTYLHRLHSEGLTEDGVLVHVANSAATLRVPEWHYDMVRLGISAYGFPPGDGFPIPVDLRQAMNLYSFITRVVEINAGQSVGYGATFTSSRRSRIATIPIGYGDGYLRHLSNLGYVLIRGQRAPVVGNVCMDQLMVDVTDIGDVEAGECATLYGKAAPRDWTFSKIDGLSEKGQSNYLVNSFQQLADTQVETVSIYDLANRAGTISYELVCALSSRVPHLYTGLDTGLDKDTSN